VDFSECDIEELILENAHVPIHAKITPDQFIALFKKNINLFPFESDIENRVPSEFNEECLIGKTAEDKEILFFYAVFLNNLSMVEFLLENNVDIRKKTILGYDAVIYAFKFERLECISKFIEKGKINRDDIYNAFLSERMNINSATASRQMLIAAEINQFDIAKAFINLGADINYLNRGTALHHAAHYKNSDAITFLLSQGANANLRNNLGFTAIEISILQKDWTSLQIFENKIIRNGVKVKISSKGLLFAILENRFDVVKILMRAGAHIRFLMDAVDILNLPNYHLHEAMDMLKVHAQLICDIELLAILLEAGATFTPAHWQEIKIAGFERKKEHCSRLLPYAARANQHKVVQKLLKSFADINARDPSGHTALHHAVWRGHREMVKFLLDHNADPTIIAKEVDPRTTPLHYAASLRQWESVKLLILKNNRPIPGEIILGAIKNNQHELIIELLRKKINIGDINIRMNEKTALHYAIEQKNVEMARLLVAAGANDRFCLLKLIDEAIKNNEIEPAIQLLAQDNNCPLICELFQLIQTHNFPTEINKCFLNFYEALQNDASRNATKDIILQHFIDILKPNEANGEEEQKHEEKAQKNLLILQKILNSEQDLKNKLNGKPPVSIGLQIALGTLIGMSFILGITVPLCLVISAAGLGKLIFIYFIFSFVAVGAPRGYAAYFKHREYNKEKVQNNGRADAMLTPFRVPSPA
jgi:ankyrin repeat protein